MRYLLTICGMTLAATLIICGPASAAQHITNGSEPRDGRQEVQLKELWRAGGEDDEVFFGLVPRVATDPEGKVYILDSQTCRVYVYSPDGELQRTLFQEGEGPGEVRRPRDMALMGDGRVGLIQELPGAVSFVTGDGTPAGRTQFIGPDGGVVNLTGCTAAGDVLLVSGNHDQEGSRPEIRRRFNVLERYDADGVLAARYAASTAEYDFTNFYFREKEHLPLFWFTFAAATDGRVFTAVDHQRYAIEVHGADGALQQVIERAYEPLQRTPQEMRRIELMIKSAFNGVPFQPTIEIEKTEAALSYFHRAIQLHPDGTLWVLSGRGVRPRQPGVMAVFDVFDQKGVFIRQVALHADHDARDVGIFLSGEDRILVIKGYMDSLAAQFGNGTALSDEGHEPQPPEVVCYQIR